MVDVGVVLICGAPPQYEQELQSSGADSKERHVCYTGFGNAGGCKDCCHDNAIKVRNMIEYDDWPHTVSLCNVLPAPHFQAEEVETKANAQGCPKPASSDENSQISGHI